MESVERRSDMQKLQTDIALIQQREGFIEKLLSDHIEETKASFNDIKELVRALTLKIDSNSVQKDVFEDHVKQDRWMFGLLVTMQLGILVKMFL